MSSILTYGTIISMGYPSCKADNLLNCLQMTGELPKYVYRQTVRGHTYYRFRRGTFQMRLPALESPEFQAAYALALDGGGTRRQNTERDAIKRYLLGEALPRAKRRSVEYGLPFDLTPEYMAAMLEAQQYKCAVSGIHFDLARSGLRKATTRLPFRPSVDRVDPPKGYIQGNVRILCFAVNMGLGDWGDDVFREICRAVA